MLDLSVEHTIEILQTETEYNLKYTVYVIITVYFCQFLYFSDLKNTTCTTNNSVNEQEAAFIHLLASQGHIYMGKNVCLHFDQTREDVLRKVRQRDSSSHPRNLIAVHPAVVEMLQ